MSTTSHPVLTIGHSAHSLEAFLALLKQHGATAVVDVRSAPYSRLHPQFNKEILGRSLKAHGIWYVFLGRELGARSVDPSKYENGRVQYERLASSRLFHEGIKRVMRAASEHSIALMCAEKEPLECHRSLLVARALTERGVLVSHILADGRLESHSDAMVRLLDLVGLPREDLFQSRQELISLALEKQERRIAHVDKRLVAETGRATR